MSYRPRVPSPSLLGTVVDAFAQSGIDLSRVGLAWARVSPAVAIVPAFGLRALPAAARGVLALVLAVTIFPAVPALSSASVGHWPFALLEQVLLGLPLALAAAVPLWATTMAGGVADTLRGASNTYASPAVEGAATPLGIPLSLLASSIFLATGGPARVVTALIDRPLSSHPLTLAAHDIVAGVTLAVSVGGPVLAAAVVVEVAGALVARAASPAQVHLLFAPMRALALLGVMAVVLPRMIGVLTMAIGRAP